MSTIEELRNKVSYTQEEMSDVLGISSKTLSKYENDSTYLPTALLKKYMEFFNINFDDIF